MPAGHACFKILHSPPVSAAAKAYGASDAAEKIRVPPFYPQPDCATAYQESRCTFLAGAGNASSNSFTSSAVNLTDKLP